MIVNYDQIIGKNNDQNDFGQNGFKPQSFDEELLNCRKEYQQLEAMKQMRRQKKAETSSSVNSSSEKIKDENRPKLA